MYNLNLVLLQVLLSFLLRTSTLAFEKLPIYQLPTFYLSLLFRLILFNNLIIIIVFTWKLNQQKEVERI